MRFVPLLLTACLSLPLLTGCVGAPSAVALCAPGDQACVRRKMDSALSTQEQPWQSAVTSPGQTEPPASQAQSQEPAPQPAPHAARRSRRAVPAYPVTVAPVTPVAPPAVPPHPTVPSPAAPASPPPTVTTCDAGGCWNTGGGRYEGGAGNTYLDNSGRLCQKQGSFMQCF